MRSPKSEMPDLFALAQGAPAGDAGGAPENGPGPAAGGPLGPGQPWGLGARPGAAPPGVEHLLEGLNDAQKEAVLHERGPLLILAGAGSGKTRVITRRITYLIAARGVHPSHVLALTFTNKAASEMRQRVERSSAAPGAWISTFHSTCARILRREIEVLAGYTRDFSIYDTGDRNQLLKQILQRESFDTMRYKPASVGAWISSRKNEMGARWLEDIAAAGAGGFEDELLASAARAYDEALRSANALDFDDLMLKLLQIFEEHPGVRDAYARRFEHVMVDEYQDTNRVQYELMRHLAGHHGNLAVCGDPDQSIYGWRGADVRNILDFERDFPGALVVRLEQNYRSRQNILDAAQGLIRQNSARIDKRLWSERGAGEKIASIECGDEDEEAREIVSAIRELERSGARPDSFAVFYRINFMQRAIERALRLAQIPYQIVAGTEFYQRREIKDLVAWLKLIVNPQDSEAARRALQAPARGVGDKTVELLARFAEDRRIGWVAAAASQELRGQVRGKGKAALEAFAASVERLASWKDRPAHEALSRVIEEVEYFKWLEHSAEENELDRAANVEELLTYASDYDKSTPDGGLRGFLQDIALVSDSDAYAPGEPKVTLMTLHAAKGLEFPHVFIAGLEEELLPHARALMVEGDPWLAIEEERRLFYVGITRAMDRLYLSRARVRRHFGRENSTTPSRFLKELPQELLRGFEADQDEEAMLGRYAPDEVAHGSFVAGDIVDHASFGRGRILRLSGAGANARATVLFPSHGEKTLLLGYAKLVKVEKR